MNDNLATQSGLGGEQISDPNVINNTTQGAEGANPFANIEFPKWDDAPNPEIDLGAKVDSQIDEHIDPIIDSKTPAEITQPAEGATVTFDTPQEIAPDSKTPATERLDAYIPEVGGVEKAADSAVDLATEFPPITEDTTESLEATPSTNSAIESKTPAEAGTEGDSVVFEASTEGSEEPEDIEREVNEGFSAMIARTDDLIESIVGKRTAAKEDIKAKEDTLKQRVAEIKGDIAAKEDELKTETDNTNREIRAIRATISDLDRKRELAEAQKKRILAVQNTSEAIN